MENIGKNGRIIVDLKSVKDYNDRFGLPTEHPLVSVIDLAESTKRPENMTINYGLYAVFLKNTKCGDIRYGKQNYDYQDGTITSLAPGQVVETAFYKDYKPDAQGVLFHPDLIKGTELGREIGSYSFFSYSSAEALHLSLEERALITDCLKNIRAEMLRPYDKLSKKLICRNIQLLLDYCMRFYERQFVTRHTVNTGVLIKFESLLDNYFASGQTQSHGLPTVKYFADRVCLSSNYFGDLIKKETGKTAQEYIQNKTIDLAKGMLLTGDKSVSEVAYDLGFQYPQHFTRLFKNAIGLSPVEYKRSMGS